uniref:Inositol-pentakisphosphate 2-kinase n=1 Tax=Macrostomum lignano TaxID=282301 RepID=A0A1I8IC87_9PLAT
MSSRGGSSVESKVMATWLSVTHSPMRCLLSCLLTSILPSADWVNRAVCRCAGRAASASDRACIRAATSGSASSTMERMTRPAPFNIAVDGCWNSLKNARPLAAVMISRVSKWPPSLSCIGCISELMVSMAACPTPPSSSARRSAATTFRPRVSRMPLRSVNAEKPALLATKRRTAAAVVVDERGQGLGDEALLVLGEEAVLSHRVEQAAVWHVGVESGYRLRFAAHSGVLNGPNRSPRSIGARLTHTSRLPDARTPSSTEAMRASRSVLVHSSELLTGSNWHRPAELTASTTFFRVSDQCCLNVLNLAGVLGVSANCAARLPHSSDAESETAEGVPMDYDRARRVDERSAGLQETEPEVQRSNQTRGPPGCSRRGLQSGTAADSREGDNPSDEDGFLLSFEKFKQPPSGKAQRCHSWDTLLTIHGAESASICGELEPSALLDSPWWHLQHRNCPRCRSTVMQQILPRCTRFTYLGGGEVSRHVQEDLARCRGLAWVAFCSIRVILQNATLPADRLKGWAVSGGSRSRPERRADVLLLTMQGPWRRGYGHMRRYLMDCLLLHGWMLGGLRASGNSEEALPPISLIPGDHGQLVLRCRAGSSGGAGVRSAVPLRRVQEVADKLAEILGPENVGEVRVWAEPWRSAWTVAEDFRIARSVMRSIRQAKSVSECIARMKFTWKPNRSPQVLVDEIECVSKKPWLIECKPFNLTFPVMNLGHDEVLNNEATANKPFYCKQYVKSAPSGGSEAANPPTFEDPLAETALTAATAAAASLAALAAERLTEHSRTEAPRAISTARQIMITKYQAQTDGPQLPWRQSRVPARQELANPVHTAGRAQSVSAWQTVPAGVKSQPAVQHRLPDGEQRACGRTRQAGWPEGPPRGWQQASVASGGRGEHDVVALVPGGLAVWHSRGQAVIVIGPEVVAHLVSKDAAILILGANPGQAQRAAAEVPISEQVGQAVLRMVAIGVQIQEAGNVDTLGTERIILARAAIRRSVNPYSINPKLYAPLFELFVSSDKPSRRVDMSRRANVMLEQGFDLRARPLVIAVHRRQAEGGLPQSGVRLQSSRPRKYLPAGSTNQPDPSEVYTAPLNTPSMMLPNAWLPGSSANSPTTASGKSKAVVMRKFEHKMPAVGGELQPDWIGRVAETSPGPVQPARRQVQRRIAQPVARPETQLNKDAAAPASRAAVSNRRLRLRRWAVIAAAAAHCNSAPGQLRWRATFFNAASSSRIWRSSSARFSKKTAYSAGSMLSTTSTPIPPCRLDHHFNNRAQRHRLQRRILLL